MFKEIVDDARRTLDIGLSQKLTMSTLCSGELKKEKMLITSNFSFFHSVFYTFGELSAIFINSESVVCKLSVWKSLKFVIWERVNSLHNDKF